MTSKSLNNSLNGSMCKDAKNTQNYQTLIPMSRVKTIMKSSPEITNISNDTLFVVCKATVYKSNFMTSFNFLIFIFKKKK
jgi:hypothetical protein